MSIEEFWNRFLQETGRDKNKRYIDCFHFELTEKWANEIEGDRIPKVGDYSIVTDWNGNPRCVIETTNVTTLPFKDMTFEICKREGEDDSLDSWRNGHIRFFTDEGKELGYQFSEDMPVLFEDFKVVFCGG